MFAVASQMLSDVPLQSALDRRAFLASLCARRLRLHYQLGLRDFSLRVFRIRARGAPVESSQKVLAAIKTKFAFCTGVELGRMYGAISGNGLRLGVLHSVRLRRPAGLEISFSEPNAIGRFPDQWQQSAMLERDAAAHALYRQVSFVSPRLASGRGSFSEDAGRHTLRSSPGVQGSVCSDVPPTSSPVRLLR